jgi:hypothetical protein
MTKGSTTEGSVGLEALGGELQGPAVLGEDPDDVLEGPTGISASTSRVMVNLVPTEGTAPEVFTTSASPTRPSARWGDRTKVVRAGLGEVGGGLV